MSACRLHLKAGYRISSFKRRGVYSILGLLGAALIRGGGVYKGAAFILNIKIKEREIACQFKTARYFSNHTV